MDTSPDDLPLTLSPIGFIRTGRDVKFQAPHQPELHVEERSVVELLPGHGFERALSDLAGFERIWLVWWFHRNKSWRPMVLPPRGNRKRRGVFSTRSPHRPNPIGLTAVSLHSVSGLSLVVGSNDLVEGTPILDIKPYLPKADAFPGSELGWLQEVESLQATPKQFEVELKPHAERQLQWLKEHWGIEFFPRAREILERDPTPHRTRRITKRAGGIFRMGCGAWRMYFSVEGNQVVVQEVLPGYPPALLEKEGADQVPYREAQLAFAVLWGNPAK